MPAGRVFPLPDRADFELGASIGIAGATAHRALTVAAGGPSRLQPGALRDRTVLVAGDTARYRPTGADVQHQPGK